MKLTSLILNYKCFLISILACALYSCNSQTKVEGQNQRFGEYNTTIVVNFKKNSDRQYVPFTQLNPIYFEPPLITPPSNFIDSFNKLKTIIKVINIDEPRFLALGFNVFYIEPGDSLNLNYEILVNTKYTFKDTITINHGNVFFISPFASRSPRLNIYMRNIRDSVKNLKNSNLMVEFLSNGHLNTIVANYTKKIYEDFPNLKHDENTLTKIMEISLNSIYWPLLWDLKYLFKETGDEFLKDAMLKGALSMLDYACVRDDAYLNSITWSKYLSLYNFFKETDINDNSILAKFHRCSDTVNQFILLNLFKDGLFEANTNSKTDSIKLFSKLTYPLFSQAAVKIYQNNSIRGIEKSGFISNTIRNTVLYDATGRKHLFGDLFKTAEQPYIIFDFAGSWCKPCLDEITLYTKSKHLNNSKKIKPIWIFFENDKSAGFEAINKYNLKKENCFVIEGESCAELMKEFTILFDWGGEFPHHFLFTKDGKIVDKDAKSLGQFKEQDIIQSKKNTNKDVPLLPTLPPS